MVNLARRYFLGSIIGIGLSVSIASPSPAILRLRPKDNNDILPLDLELITWLKRVGDKSVEEKYDLISSDGKVEKKHKGSITYYTSEAKLGNDKWGVVYADSGPVSRDTGLYSADGVPNMYDNLYFDFRNNPLLEQRLDDPVEFYAKLGSGLYSGRLGGKLFLSPNSLEYKTEFQKLLKSLMESEDGSLISRVREVWDTLESNRRLFEAAEKMYLELRQKLRYIIK